MLCEITSTHLVTKDYPVPYAFTGSSGREETDMSEMLDWRFFTLMRQELLRQLFFHRSLLPSFEIDLSSVRPLFEPLSRTSLTEEFYQVTLPEEMLEYDIIVRMPPRKNYGIQLEVRSVKKAQPRIVEPERF